MENIEHWNNLSLIPIVEEIDGVVYVEEWRPIKRYKGMYEVSNFGRVKSLGRAIQTKTRPKYNKSEKIIKSTPTDKRGYLRAPLTRNSISKHFYVHRLVGIHFLPNPHKKRTVNHKFGNKKDNRVWFLEWNTHGENHEHSYRELGRKHAMSGITGYDNKASKEILCITTGEKFGSLSEAGRALNIPFQNISKVCKGKRPTAHGLVFKYTNG